jgi:hypothetical protein
MDNQYEVLSPWAEADPVPLKGISPRLSSLKGKRIGLFHHSKLAGPRITAAVEKALKEKYPTADFSYFRFSRLGDLDSGSDRGGLGITATDPLSEKKELESFESWIEGVDAAVAAVGD